MEESTVKKMRPSGKALAISALFCWLVVSPLSAQSADIVVSGAPIPIHVLAQSPADTVTDLQVICLFLSSPENALHGSLLETDKKLNGLLQQVRKPDLFRGELGETLLITPPKGSLGAKRLLIIGLGDSQSFSLQRMQLVGEILYSDSAQLGVANPFFAPTILDGGVSKFKTGEVSEQVISGFLRAAAINKLARDAHASDSTVEALTFLAGIKNVSSTRAGIENAIAAAAKK